MYVNNTDNYQQFLVFRANWESNAILQIGESSFEAASWSGNLLIVNFIALFQPVFFTLIELKEEGKSILTLAISVH